MDTVAGQGDGAAVENFGDLYDLGTTGVGCGQAAIVVDHNSAGRHNRSAVVTSPPPIGGGS